MSVLRKKKRIAWEVIRKGKYFFKVCKLENDFESQYYGEKYYVRDVGIMLKDCRSKTHHIIDSNKILCDGNLKRYKGVSLYNLDLSKKICSVCAAKYLDKKLKGN